VSFVPPNAGLPAQTVDGGAHGGAAPSFGHRGRVAIRDRGKGPPPGPGVPKKLRPEPHAPKLPPSRTSSVRQSLRDSPRPNALDECAMWQRVTPLIPLAHAVALVPAGKKSR